MKLIYIILAVFIFSLNGFSQSKFTGELSFLSTTDNKVTDSFQLIIAKDYIEKKYTFSLNVLRFDYMVLIKDSGRIYYINNDLRTVLWRNLKSDSWDTAKYKETSTKKDIKGKLCTLFTIEEKRDWLPGEQILFSKRLWLSKDLVIDYGDKYYENLQTLGIYEHGLMLESNTIIEREKRSDTNEVKLLSIAETTPNRIIKLPEGFMYKEYNRENILNLIREQNNKINTPEKIMEMIREREQKQQ